MTCQEIQDRILSADDPHDLGDELDAHVFACADCSAFVRRLVAIESAARELPVEGSEVAKAAVMRRVRAGQLRPARRLVLRPMWGLVAAVLVVGIGLGIYLAQPPVASAAVVDQLVDWNLELANAPGAQEREHLYTSRAGAFD